MNNQNGGEGQGKRNARSDRTKERDRVQKQTQRKLTRKQLETLADLEDEARDREEQPAGRLRDNVQFIKVVTAVIKRIRQGKHGKAPVESGRHGTSSRRSGGASGASSSSAPLQVPDIQYRDIMQSSRTCGTLLVNMQDLVVRESNFAMETFCPFDRMRGYRGHELIVCVHPDDHVQLQNFWQMLQGCVPGRPPVNEQGRPLSLRLRLLRADTDVQSGILVFQYLWQTLEVACVGPYIKGILHVLLVCDLGQDSVVPLQFTTSDRRLWDMASKCFSGVYTLDSVISSATHDTGTEHANHRFATGLFQFMGNATNPSSFLDWLATFTSTTLKGCLQSRLTLGSDPDGMPWYQRDCSIRAFGMRTNFHKFGYCKLSPATFAEIQGESRHVICGFLRPTDRERFEAGIVGLGLPDSGSSSTEQKHCWILAHSVWSFDPVQCRTCNKDIFILRDEDSRGAGKRFDVFYEPADDMS